jgi:hypothetical protein
MIGFSRGGIYLGWKGRIGTILKNKKKGSYQDFWKP